MRYNIYLVIIMATITYLIRAIPIVFLDKKIKSNWIKNFLEYTPYTVLGAMTFPAILYSTGSLSSAMVGLVVSILLAFQEKSLVFVAISTVAAVYISQLIV